MNTYPTRVVIYTKDVATITGLKERAARKLLSDIRKHVKKDRGSFITILEFSHYTGICEESIRTCLQ